MEKKMEDKLAKKDAIKKILKGNTVDIKRVERKIEEQKIRHSLFQI